MSKEKRNIGQELISGLQEIIDGNAARTTEANLVQCKVCQDLKVKIEAGKYPKGKTKKYVDEHNVQWNGKVCPECNRERVKKNMAVKRLVTPIISE